MKVKLTVVLIVLLYSCILYSQVNTQWITRFNGPAGSNDVPTCITTDAEGNIYVGGYSFGGGTDNDCMFIKYSPTGEELWKHRYNNIVANKSDQLNAIAVDNRGNVYGIGASTGDNTQFDFIIIKLDTKGERVWTAVYDGDYNNNDDAVALVLDSDGNPYVTGFSTGEETSIDFCTIKFDASTGNKLWIQRYNNSNNSTDYATDIKLDNNNNVIVCGYSETMSSGTDYTIIKYTNNGLPLWNKKFNGPANSDDKAIVMNIDNTDMIYVTGSSMSKTSNLDYATIQMNSTGEILWEARYNGPGNNIDIPTSLAIDNNGDIHITGKSMGNGTDFDFATITYNPEGVELWASRFNAQGNSSDEPASISLDELGSIYVTGAVWNGTDNDYATIKYNPLGDELWIARYNGPGNQVDRATAVIVDKSGNIIVTGFSIGTATQYDIATIKYQQAPPEAVPVLQSPAFGSSGINPTPALEWNVIRNADFYKLQVATDKSFSTIIIDSNISISTGMHKVAEKVLENNTQYFWRLAALNIAGTGQWSPTWNFSVLTAPDSPELLSPLNGAAGQPSTPTLIWQNSSTAETYRVQISRDYNFSEIIVDQSALTANEYTIPNGLLSNNAQYFWRVNASNVGGTVPWSNTWTLGIGAVNPPVQPVLTSLPDKSVGQSLNPTLDWQDISSVANYRIQIASDLNFTQIVVDEGGITNSNYTVPSGKLQNNTTYYWKVLATNLGGTGPWSLIWTYSTMVTGMQRVGKDYPKDAMLYNNSPEPFSSITSIRFDLPSTLDNTQVSIVVYDLLGREVSRIIDEKVKAGAWTVQWDGSNFPRGYYLYQIRAKSFVQTKKMMLVK